MRIELNSSDFVAVVSFLLALGTWAWYRKRYRVCLGQPISMSQAGYVHGSEVHVLQVHCAIATVYLTLQRNNNEIIVVYFENYVTDGETLLIDLQPGYYWYLVRKRVDHVTGLVMDEERLIQSHPALRPDTDLWERRLLRTRSEAEHDRGIED